MFVKKVWVMSALLLALGSGFASAETAADEAAVLVRLGDITVTADDVERYVALNMPGEDIAKALGQPGNIEQYLRNLLMVRSLSARAQQEQKGPDAAQLAWQLKYQTDRMYTEALQKAVIAEAIEGGDWEALARETYIAESERFVSPDRIDAAHILIATNTRSEEEALAQVKLIQQRLAAGDDFNTLAQEYSDDTGSAQSAGELGIFNASKMVPEFAAVAFELAEPGDISEPVKTQFGYHIIKLNKKFAGKKQPFERVSEELIQEMQNKVAKQTIATMLGLLRHETLKAERDVTELNKFYQKYGLSPANPPVQEPAK